MSETKFTPGPWRSAGIKPHLVEDGTVTVEIEKPYAFWSVKRTLGMDGGGRRHTFIAEVHRCGLMSDDEMEANARLIAAAPDLYAFALEYAERRVVAGGMSVDDETLDDMCDAALAKARGEEWS